MDRRASLSMNRFVFANEVKQSMTSECMDCRATLAVTKSLFKVRVRFRPELVARNDKMAADLHSI